MGKGLMEMPVIDAIIKCNSASMKLKINRRPRGTNGGLGSGSSEAGVAKRASVTAYTTSSAHLSLEHNCPRGSAVKAVVDVNLLLRNLKTEQTDVGQWVHVIGYITSIKHPPGKTTASNVRGRGATCINVQAIVLWTAQDLDIATYEQTLMAESE
ncbi:telomere capping, CST complex subunit-domain-containing protein [Biscogniauxia mediterranea]|nr:telomere capping, CST complex subunit-domain-containing protein [Biscogniauxia mediterranea]